MGAAAILSDLLILGPHPLFDTCRKLRGLDAEHFTRWADKVSSIVYSNNRQFSRLIKGTFKSFEERIAANPDCVDELIALCEKVEAFLNTYR